MLDSCVCKASSQCRVVGQIPFNSADEASAVNAELNPPPPEEDENGEEEEDAEAAEALAGAAIVDADAVKAKARAKVCRIPHPDHVDVAN